MGVVGGQRWQKASRRRACWDNISSVTLYVEGTSCGRLERVHFNEKDMILNSKLNHMLFWTWDGLEPNYQNIPLRIYHTFKFRTREPCHDSRTFPVRLRRRERKNFPRMLTNNSLKTLSTLGFNYRFSSCDLKHFQPV